MRLIRGGPELVTDFKCFGLNVVGEGIPSVDSSFVADWQTVAAGKTCAYPGLTSSLQALGSSSGSTGSKNEIAFPIKVSPGKSRVFQIIGVQTEGGCPEEDLGKLLAQNRSGALSEKISGLYEVGRAVTDVYQANNIDVTASYKAGSAYNLKDCYPPPGSGGNDFVLSDFPIGLSNGDKYQLKPRGGTAPFKYRVISEGAGAFASVDRETGLVTAAGGPPLPNTIEVTDFDNRTARVTAKLFTPAAYGGLLQYWYRASQFLGQITDGADLPDSNRLKNSGSGGSNSDMQTGILLANTNSVRFRTASAPRGSASVELYSGFKYERSDAGVALGGAHQIFLVVKRSKALNGSAMCLGVFSACLPTGHGSTLLWPDTTATYTYRLLGNSGASTTINYDAGKELGWTVLSGKWDGTSGTDGLQLTVNGNVTKATTANTSISVAGGIISVGPITGQTGVDFMEFAEMLIYTAAVSETAVYEYLQYKYGL